MTIELESEATGVEVVVGRQAIFDHNRSVIAYELLFRQLAIEVAMLPSGELMTAEVIFNSLSIGVDRLVGDKRAYLNAERNLLTGDGHLLLPPGRVVVEVLETVEPDREVVEGCRRLADRGYRLALDDFVWRDGIEPLLELASVVKLDVLAIDREELPGLMERCRAFDVQLLAEKVETPAQLLDCVELGFDYFQGYLLSRPQIVSGRSLAPDAATRLRLAARLVDDECDVREIEAMVKTSPGLTYQLLELAGIGAAHGTRRQVRTIREAIVLVGSRRLQSWAALLLLVQPGPGSSEVWSTALVRARMCELLAMPDGAGQAGEAFVAGMVSTFDLLLGLDIEEVFDVCTLGDELRRDATGGDSTIGRIVADVIDYQLGMPELASRSGYDDVTLHVAFTEALAWALEVGRSLN